VTRLMVDMSVPFAGARGLFSVVSGSRWDGVVGADEVVRVDRRLDRAQALEGRRGPQGVRWSAGVGEVEGHVPGRPGSHRLLHRRDLVAHDTMEIEAGSHADRVLEVLRLDRRERPVRGPVSTELTLEMPDLDGQQGDGGLGAGSVDERVDRGGRELA
jgi:hypothetical protein